jgi:phospholipid/cholesterol/gamma-HCH transport system ATP-binding protein
MIGETVITVRDLEMGYDEFVVMRDLNFTVNRGDFFIIMGASGCGKSTLLKILIGLKEPSRGRVLYGDTSFWEIVSLKLSLVGLAGFDDYYPSELSGGMKKRAALARAMALDPDILFFDEPSAGLDPISGRLLDDLILELRDGLGTTIIVVTHDLAGIFAIGNNSIFLDVDLKTMTASGDPKQLLAESRDPAVRRFLTRGGAGREEES